MYDKKVHHIADTKFPRTAISNRIKNQKER